jgi:lipopolysaccharide transport system ATP-binding protein
MVDAIAVQGLGKRFRQYRGDHPRTLKEALLSGLRRSPPEQDFWALRDLTFAIEAGHMVGIVGPNGAGKSTLLRLIGGVVQPDEGQVTVNGQIGALLDLGAGFHPDLTGRENVFVNGVISGLTRQDIARRFDSIVDFAELAEFIDSPLRTYSTGMQLRLGFAVAVHTDPEILLIDEILAVGDLAFQRKCIDRIVQFRDEGRTVVLVSHDPGSIQELCDEALWLRKGKVAAYGPAKGIVDQYVKEMSAETRRRTPALHPTMRTSTGIELRANENRFGSMEMEIIDVQLLDAADQSVSEVPSGETLRVQIMFLAPEPIQSPIFGITVSLEDATICYDTSTAAMGIETPTVQGEGQITLHIERLDLIGNQYYIDVWVYEREWAYAYDFHWHGYPLFVHSPGGEKGIIRPPVQWLWGDELPA